MRAKGRFGLAIILLTGLCGFSGKSSVEKAVTDLRTDPVLKARYLGFILKELGSDSVIYAWDADRALIPASSLKLFTCAAALDIIGADYAYATKLIYTGNFDKKTGIIEGDLVMIGSGDPTIDSKYFASDSGTKYSGVLEKWVAELKKMGVKEIKGKVLADASVFEDSLAAPGWPAQDLGNYYASGAAGINYRDNSYRLFFKTGTVGTKAILLNADPRIPGMSFDSQVKAGGKTDNAFIIGKEYTYARKITGTLPPNQEKFDIDGSIPDPPAFCAYTFDSLLNASGIGTSGDQPDLFAYRSTKKISGITLCTHTSPALSLIVEKCLYYSHNLYAEALLKTLAAKMEGKGTRAGGVKIISDWLKKKGINLQDFDMKDGSGLSPENKITSRQFADMLSSFSKTEASTFIWSGLKKYGTRVYTKSGYISGVRAYCGYVKGSSGKKYSFALIANAYACTPAQARIKLEKVLNTFTQLP